MAREESIYEQRHAFDVIPIEAETIIEDFKKDLLAKIFIEVEPILNSILTHKYLSIDDQHLLITNIKEHINIYYYMGDKETLIKLINHLSSPDHVKILKSLKEKIENNQYPKDFKLSSETLKKHPTSNLKEIVQIRYKSLLIRYINYLLTIYS